MVTEVKTKRDDFEWLREHYKELREKYPGKVVAIADREIVGCGDTIQEAEKQAKRVTSKTPLFGRIRKKGAMIL